MAPLALETSGRRWVRPCHVPPRFHKTNLCLPLFAPAVMLVSLPERLCSLFCFLAVRQHVGRESDLVINGLWQPVDMSLASCFALFTSERICD